MKLTRYDYCFIVLLLLFSSSSRRQQVRGVDGVDDNPIINKMYQKDIEIRVLDV